VTIERAPVPTPFNPVESLIIMRRTLCRLLHIATLLSLSAVVTYAQSVDELVSKNLAAKGGVDKLKGVQTMKLTGTISAGGMNAPFTISSKRPNLARQETELQGTAMVRAFDGTTPWMSMGGQTREITGPEAQATREQADFDSPLVDYAAKGNRIELVGPDTVDGAKVFHLKVTTKSGQIQQYFLDAETGLERETSVTLNQNGQDITVDSLLSDYREVSGLKIPFKIKQTVNGTPVTELTIEKAEFNVPLDDSVFKMPKTPKPGGA
jgi:outer membrane lipoprotein-sorting protein